MNSDISYIMSCSDVEFENVTGVRLPDEAWERWCKDMEERKEQLLLVVQKAIKIEREACAKEAERTFYSVQAAENIRARGQA